LIVPVLPTPGILPDTQTPVSAQTVPFLRLRPVFGRTVAGTAQGPKLCPQSCQEVKPNQGQLPRSRADSRLFWVHRKNNACLICAVQYIWPHAGGRAAQNPCRQAL